MAFLDVFHAHGIDLDLDEIRRFMGIAKRDHIRQVLSLEEVGTSWQQRYDRMPEDADVDRLYQEFLGLQMEVIPQYSALIEGVPAAICKLQTMGIRIGSTTGYPSEVMEALIPLAAAGGFAPECVVTVSEVSEGRPAPWMILRNAEAMGIHPLSRIAVVDDTVSGIQAGRNAGCLAIGVSRTGNLVGLSKRALDELAPGERKKRIEQAKEHLLAAGADLVVESVADLPAALDSSVPPLSSLDRLS